MYFPLFIWGGLGEVFGGIKNDGQTLPLLTFRIVKELLNTLKKELHMNINKTRGLLYKIARILGDVQAAKNGTLGKRVTRRAAGKATNKLLKNLFK